MSSNRVSSTQGSRDSRQTTATNASTGGRTTAPAEERSSTARSAGANSASHRSGVSSSRDSRSLDASGNSSNEGGLGRGGGSRPLPTAAGQAGYGSGSQPAVAAAGAPTARPPPYQSSVPSVTNSPSVTNPPSYYAGTPAPTYSFVSSEHSSEYSDSTHAPMHSQARHGQTPHTGAARSAGTARDYGHSPTTHPPPTSHPATRGHNGRTDASANHQSLPYAPGMGHSLSQGPPATAHANASASPMVRTHSHGPNIPGYAPGQHRHYAHEPYQHGHQFTEAQRQNRTNTRGGVYGFSAGETAELEDRWQQQSGNNATPSIFALHAMVPEQGGRNAPPTSHGSQAPGSMGMPPSQGHRSNQAPSNQGYASQSHRDPRARYPDQPPRRAPGGGRQ